MSTPPRFLLDDGVLERLAVVDSSYAECSLDGRLALFVDYRRGVPQSVQVIRMAALRDATDTVYLKVHISRTDSA